MFRRRRQTASANRSRAAKRFFLSGVLLLAFSVSTQAAILWSDPGPVTIRNNGAGKDILHGAIKPQDTNSSSTIYFRFRVDPISDSATKSIADFEAGMVFVDKGQEHLGIGNSLGAWAYCAMNVPESKKGYVDLNSATSEPGFAWEYMRAGSPRYIAFKVQYVPGQDARVTAWLNPDLALGATEVNQPTNLVVRFETRATFDEIHLIHRGIGGGWIFSQMMAATSFEDLALPHFWQRGWFFATSTVAVLLLVAGSVRLLERKRAQRKIQWLERERAVATERTRIARDIHDEVGISLTKISKLTELMNLSGETGSRNEVSIQTIAQTARHTIRAMDEIVWAINPRNDTLEEMADYLAYFTEDFLRSAGINCRLEVPSRLPDIPLTAEVRHNVFMVLKEALNNAVKHGAPRQIRLSLELKQDGLLIEVADDGCGFDLDGNIAMGNGLENMQKRLKAIGGELKLDSEPGRGTTVRLQVPLEKNSIAAR
ncbi:MAG TPA: sensor histidine kinase [Verrucomicrobiae bacterium]